MKHAIYLTGAGTATARPVTGLFEVSDLPTDDFAARLAAQVALLGVGEASIQVPDTAEFSDLDSDASTYDYTVDTTATPPVAMTPVTVARLSLAQKQTRLAARRDAALNVALQLLAADRVLTETDLGTVETYLAALRAISDTEADPDGYSFPSLGTLANNASATLRVRTYRRGNVIATVAQASGVPTGGLFEEAANTNGRYVRFAGGTQKCYGIRKATFVNSTLLLASWTFPGAFSETDNLFIGGFLSSVRPDGTTEGLPLADMEACQVIGTARSTTGANFQVRSPSYNFVSGDEVWLNVEAVGQWA
jgi:hypothetical protein